MVRIGVKPMAGHSASSQSKQEYELEPSDDVRVLRELVSNRLECEPGDLKLIFKGRFLKDGMEIESVGGLTDGAVVHAHVSSASKAKPVPSGGLSAEQEREQDEGDASRAGIGRADATSSNPMEGMIRNAIGDLPGGNNPEVMNELNRMLQDPSTMQRMMRIANNPDMQLEYMRSMDRALSNIESAPGGFNALASMLGRHNEGDLQGSDGGDAEGARLGADSRTTRRPVNPFDRLFEGTSVSNDPMPNPWQRGAGQQQTGPGGLGGLGGLGGMPMGAGMPGIGDIMTQLESMSTEERERLIESMQEMLPQLGLGGAAGDVPSMEQMHRMMNTDGMATLARLPEMSDEQIAEHAGQIRQGLQEMGGGLPPEMAAQFFANLTDEALVQMLREMRDVMRRVQQGDMSALGGGLGGEPRGLQAMLSGMGLGGTGPAGLAGLAGLSRQQQPISEAEMNEKIQQLQSMGFLDEQANRRALQMTNGNVNAAVEILLSSPPL